MATINKLTFLALEAVEHKHVSRGYRTDSQVVTSGIVEGWELFREKETVMEDAFTVLPEYSGMTRLRSNVQETGAYARSKMHWGAMTFNVSLDKPHIDYAAQLDSRQPDVQSMTVLGEYARLFSSLTTKITAGNTLVSGEASIRSSILESDVAGSGDALGDLKMVLEVFKHCEYSFIFPKNFLRGLESSAFAKVNGDTLIVYTTEIGEHVLYSAKGSITIRTLPGMKQRNTSLTRALSE